MRYGEDANKKGNRFAGSKPASGTQSPKQSSVDRNIPKFPGYDELPSDDIPPFSILIFAEPEMGKSHLAHTFPSPASGDTELKNGHICKKLGIVKYKILRNFPGIRSFITGAIADTEVDSIIIDSGSDLRTWAETYTEGEYNAKQLFSPGGRLYSKMNTHLDDIINDVKEAKKNMIWVDRVKDEWVNDKATGQRIHAGYNKVWFAFDIIIQLVQGMWHSKYGANIEKKGNRPKIGGVLSDCIFGRVVKNYRMLVTEIRPYLLDVSYNGIVKELLQGDQWVDSRDQFIEEQYESLTKHSLKEDSERKDIYRKVPKGRVVV